MKALVTTAAGQMEVQTVPDPGEPGPGEALVRVEAVGICGSDYHIFSGRHPLGRFPMVQGHEICGVVEQLGPDTTGENPEGAQVSIEPLFPCGECYPCRIGRSGACTRLEILGLQRPGGLQEQLVLPERMLHATGGMPAEIAAFAEPMSIGLQSVIRAEVGPGDRVLVMGAGPIGQATLMCARSKGAQVAVADLVDERLELARSLGADAAVRADKGLTEFVMDWTDGEGASVVADATGVPAVIEGAVDLVADAGRILLIGISKQSFSLVVGTMIRKELTVVASRNSAGIFDQAVQLVRDNQREVESLITHRLSLDQVQETIELAMSQPAMVEKAVTRLAG